ncbi:hypothetical protein B0H66DRAFT_546611 [Apodospora peruviana]|uniref:Short chain dehydrogenase n=1 Tax=Apodospora peruviana TaxID=516989 RepID=A0AAE0IV09_9PEZI|nr:hypothetical protein B0H66DRAFT_546611 [Apodospora peruviana]
MGRFFITGSSDGLGSLTAKRLVSLGHQVVLHARNPQRAKHANAACPGSTAILTADLADLQETKRLAAEANKHGPYDAVIHNAGVARSATIGKSLPSLFAVNTLAPYILTCLMAKPKRLVYVSSSMHYHGHPRLDDDGDGITRSGYSDTKLHNVMLAKAFARRWDNGNDSGSAVVNCCATDPGWVATKINGWSGRADLTDAVDMFTKLALGELQKGNGQYFADGREKSPNAKAGDVQLQDRMLEELAKISGVAVPE